MNNFQFGQSSQLHLGGVHPMLVHVAVLALGKSTQDFTITCGLRSEDEQIACVAKGTSKTMDSKHRKQPDGLSHAVDAVPVDANGKATWDWSLIYPVAAAFVVAAKESGYAHQMRWGGVWDKRLSELPDTPEELNQAVEDYAARHHGPDLLDGPHFELDL